MQPKRKVVLKTYSTANGKWHVKRCWFMMKKKKINTRQKPWTFSLLEQHCQLAERRNCQFHKLSAILNNIALKIENRKMTRLFTEESAMNLLEAIENFRQDTSNRTFPLKKIVYRTSGEQHMTLQKNFYFCLLVNLVSFCILLFPVQTRCSIYEFWKNQKACLMILITAVVTLTA